MSDEKEPVQLRITVECVICQYQVFEWQEVTELRYLLTGNHPGPCPNCQQNQWALIVRKSDVKRAK